MRFILCQPAINRFKWELDVCLTNLKKHGINDVILLFSEQDNSIPNYFEKKYQVECFVYPDNRQSKSYIPSIKPYLWWQFLKANPNAEHETYFYMDADVIFREIPDFSKINYSEKVWVGSDTESYLSPDYICSKDRDYMEKMADIIGITVKQAYSLKGHSAGAQWIITNPSANYWQKVYKDCISLYRMFSNVEGQMKIKHGKDYVPLQKWTAEMWSQLWNMVYFNIQPEIDHELDFAFATDDIDKLDKVKILHNAGVTEDKKDLFFKGQYVNRDPFKDDLSFVNKKYCSFEYVKAIHEAAN